MDYIQWPSQPSRAPPQADPIRLAAETYYPSSYTYYQTIPHQSQYLNPSSDAVSAAGSNFMQPGVAAYSSYPSGQAGYTALNGNLTVDATAPYYNSNPNAHKWALKEAIRVYGTDPNGYTGAGIAKPTSESERLAIAYPGPLGANQVFQPQGRNNWKKHSKKTKIVQSAYCEICRVDCNSVNVLDQHKLGKKHQKNLEKLQASAAPPQSSSTGSTVPLIGPTEYPNKRKPITGRKSGKKPAQPVEDVETKRRKLVEGGASLESVRTCMVCNVVCNSETVYNFHLAGQKHAAMLKRHAAQISVAASATDV